jgi:hypothetical protein
VLAPQFSCRVRGYGTALYNIGSGPAGSATFDGCKAACLAKPSCVSFGYGIAACALYRMPNSVNARPQDSAYVFYDVTCPSEF